MLENFKKLNKTYSVYLGDHLGPQLSLQVAVRRSGVQQDLLLLPPSDGLENVVVMLCWEHRRPDTNKYNINAVSLLIWFIS